MPALQALEISLGCICLSSHFCGSISVLHARQADAGFVCACGQGVDPEADRCSGAGQRGGALCIGLRQHSRPRAGDQPRHHQSRQSTFPPESLVCLYMQGLGCNPSISRVSGKGVFQVSGFSIRRHSSSRLGDRSPWACSSRGFVHFSSQMNLACGRCLLCGLQLSNGQGDHG